MGSNFDHAESGMPHKAQLTHRPRLSLTAGDGSLAFPRYALPPCGETHSCSKRNFLRASTLRYQRRHQVGKPSPAKLVGSPSVHKCTLRFPAIVLYLAHED